MAARSLAFCLSALLLQSISAQCIGSAFNPGFAGPALAGEFGFPGPYGPNLGCGCGGIGSPYAIGNNIAPCAGPVLPVAEIPPPGMSIYSDNLVIEGPVIVAGRMPFLGTVAMEGVFPTAGAGAVSYACGDGAVGIVAEGPIGALAPGLEYGPGLDGFMYDGLPGCGVGGRWY